MTINIPGVLAYLLIGVGVRLWAACVQRRLPREWRFEVFALMMWPITVAHFLLADVEKHVP